MNETNTLYQLLLSATEGVRKEGFTAANANVTYTSNQTLDIVTFTAIIPVEPKRREGIGVLYQAKDAFGFLPLEP